MADWREIFKIPLSARVKLVTPIKDAINSPLDLQQWHTLPIRSVVWDMYAKNILDNITHFRASLAEGPAEASYASVQTWLSEVAVVRSRILSATLALAPFNLFNEEGAREMLGQLDTCLFEIAREVEVGETQTFTNSADILNINCEWLTAEGSGCVDPVAEAFGLTSEDLSDESGEFSAGRVFAAYYLRNSELLMKVLPHLGSLRLPQIGDLLVAVSVVGWVLGSEDPVVAYCAMDALLSRLSRAYGTRVSHAALKYIEDREVELRQARNRINRAALLISGNSDEEDVHLALADLYKRLIEGPFRKYGWTFYCLEVGDWSEPPMLTRLRDILVSRGGWLGEVVKNAVIRDVRNGEAHETLIWDGVKRRFCAEGVEVEAASVAYAVVLADGFSRGCAAAIACHKTLDAEHTPDRPREHDAGRLAAWRRAEVVFGTNGIRLVRSNFNSNVAKITCFQLRQENVNPCLQALMLCCGLQSHVQRFDVFTLGSKDPCISVSREALENTLPVWEKALERFTAMPFSTFLPANLDARRRSEGDKLAAKSIAWIAVDDVLDALDGSCIHWGRDDVKLFSMRVEIAVIALQQCMEDLPESARTRIRAALESAVQLLEWLGGVTPPVRRIAVARADPIARFRHWWDRWGPVDRLPGVAASTEEVDGTNSFPALREEPGDLRWRTI